MVHHPGLSSYAASRLGCQRCEMHEGRPERRAQKSGSNTNAPSPIGQLLRVKHLIVLHEHSDRSAIRIETSNCCSLRSTFPRMCVFLTVYRVGVGTHDLLDGVRASPLPRLFHLARCRPDCNWQRCGRFLSRLCLRMLIAVGRSCWQVSVWSQPLLLVGTLLGSGWKA